MAFFHCFTRAWHSWKLRRRRLRGGVRPFCGVRFRRRPVHAGEGVGDRGGEVGGDGLEPGLLCDFGHEAGDGGVVAVLDGVVEGGGEFLDAGFFEDADVFFPVGAGGVDGGDFAEDGEPFGDWAAGEREEAVLGEEVLEGLVLGVGVVELCGAVELEWRRDWEAVVLAEVGPSLCVGEIERGDEVEEVGGFVGEVECFGAETLLEEGGAFAEAFVGWTQSAAYSVAAWVISSVTFWSGPWRRSRRNSTVRWKSGMGGVLCGLSLES